MPKLSIIVPVYQVEDYLERCIESILGQSFTDFELILVNDGSSDRCPEICETYKKQDERVVLIHKKNGGLSDARNAGLDLVKGYYLGFVDSDDYIDKYMYEILINVMIETDSDLVICDNYRVHSNFLTVQSWEDRDKTYSKEQAMYKILSDEIGSQAWNKLYKSKLFDSLRYPKGRTYEDLATTYKYVDRCSKVTYIKKPLYYYLLRESGISLSSNFKRAYPIYLGFKERYEFSKKSWPQFSDLCLNLKLDHALLALYYSIQEEDEAKLEEIYKSLKNHKLEVLKSNRISTKKKLQFFLLMLNKRLYCYLIHSLICLRERKKSI